MYKCNYSLSFLHSLWQTVSLEGTDIHSTDITVPRFFNISLFNTLQTSSCNGDHVCYTEDFRSFYSLGKFIIYTFCVYIYTCTCTYMYMYMYMLNIHSLFTCCLVIHVHTCICIM